MCLAIPGRIVEISPEQTALAKVDVAGVRRNVNIGLLEDGGVRPGDWVLIHVGFAMSKIERGAGAAISCACSRRSARTRWRWTRYEGTPLPNATERS